MARSTRIPSPPARHCRWIGATCLLAATLLFGACQDPGDASSDTGPAEAAGSLFDASTIHEISVSFDGADYDELIAAYSESGEKQWIEATVVIDGSTYQHAGMRLKGNSSLFQLGGAAGFGRGAAETGGADAGEPESLPWLIRLDEYVDGRNHQGIADLVVRSNVTETALNEAVALDVLEAAGLASQDAVWARFSVNGSGEVLRLIVENPDDVWMAEEFSADGALYKAEATGDYSYRGDDPDAYDEVFDQEAGESNADLTPLIEFVDFINNTDDDTFTAELPERLDVEAFATYLAAQELIGNTDDIDGPGNNSYLYLDVETGRFTVVPWDHNLAFDVRQGGGAAPGVRPGTAGAGAVNPGQAGATGQAQPGRDRPGGGGADDPGGLGGRGSNVLAERFLAIPEFEALYEQQLEALTGGLLDSGVAADLPAARVSVLESQAGDLVDAATVAVEAAGIGACFASR